MAIGDISVRGFCRARDLRKFGHRSYSHLAVGVATAMLAQLLVLLPIMPSGMAMAQVSGQQSEITIPADAIRLYYNCRVWNTHSYDRRFSRYVQETRAVFSSRNQSSCSGYTEGDYILLADTITRGGYLRYDGRLQLWIVGSDITVDDYMLEGENFDLIFNNNRFAWSLDNCNFRQTTFSVRYSSNRYEGANLCISGGWNHRGTRLSSSTAVHLVSPKVSLKNSSKANMVSLEITQGVQNWNNDLTLVRNRHTVVRAFLETNQGQQRRMTAKLEGKKLSSSGNTIWVDTVYPINPGRSITVKSDVATHRGDINSSLNFKLPESWTNLSEDETLRLELKFGFNYNVNCSNRCVEEVMFTDLSGAPKIVMVPIIAKNSDGSTSELSEISLEEQFLRIMSVIPLPHQEFEPIGIRAIGLHPFTFGPYDRSTNLYNVGGLLRILRNEADKSLDGLDLLYLGVLPGATNGGKSGRSFSIPSLVAAWFEQNNLIEHPLGYGSHFGIERNRGAHEVGHIFDQRHTIRTDTEKDGWLFIGECGERSKISRIYRYYTEINNRWRPTLGSLGDANLEVWGLDTRFMGVSGPEIDPLRVINPNQVFSVMSYCGPLERRSQGRWMDAFHHERIIEFIKKEYNNRSNLNVGGSLDTSREAVNSDMFSGYIVLSSTGDHMNVVIDSIFSRPRIQREVHSGEYTLELRNDIGETVRSVNFDVIESISEPAQGDFTLPDELTRVDFSVVVTDPPEYSSFAISKDGTEVSSVAMSANDPAVTVTGPTSGQAFNNGDVLNLSWSGSDFDGDKLYFRVYYSTDGGTTYEVLSVETESTKGSIPVSKLKGSSQARIGVSVSDGTRSSFAETPVFSVAGHSPEVKIQTPKSGTVFAEKQGFLLDASGFDFEDGGLASSAFSWVSSLDGNLGRGEFLVLSAEDLTSGSHTITVVARDSDGMTATASVNIIISDRNMLPVANDDEAFGGLEGEIEIDILANDVDVEGDFDYSLLTIVEQPKLGLARVSYPVLRRPVIKYSPITGGEDTFTYSICDGLDRCNIAEVTVAFPDCTITGTRGSDEITGTSEADVICGLDGSDTIDGKGGDDLIYAGFGEDLVYGRTGDDTIYGGPGNDFILGHRGDDTIYGGLSNDRIWGGGGDDIIWGGDEADELYGEADDDTLYGNGGPDQIHGGQGNDIIFGGDGIDSIRGNAGLDTIYANPNVDIILGVSSEDTIIDS